MTSAEVIAALARGRPLDAGSAPWTRRFIDIADEQFDRRWREIELPAAEALEIWLPAHAGEPCRGDRVALTPPGGLTVREAAARLAEIRGEYQQANPSCWARINEAAAAPFSTLILTTAPLDTDDHRHLTRLPGALYHLDGFHRLIAWALAGRLTPEVTLRGHVAG